MQRDEGKYMIQTETDRQRANSQVCQADHCTIIHLVRYEKYTRNINFKKQRNVENYETGKKVYDGRIQTDREQTSRFAKLTSAAHIG